MQPVRTAVSPLLETTDKGFWHGYLDFYVEELAGKDPRTVAEFGVLHGQSIRWLMRRYPKAHITGLDILPTQPDWPQDPRVSYVRLDQDDRAAVQAFFRGRRFDLVIEDGSHLPRHQATCLVEGFRALNPGGTYILEDIHTSHPAHSMFHAGRRALARRRGTVLSVLMALDHMRRLGKGVSDAVVGQLGHHCELTSAEVAELAATIRASRLYRRTRLPDRCYRCGATDFDYHRFKCLCGTDLFVEADSMAMVLHKSG